MAKKANPITISVSNPDSYESILASNPAELLTKIRDGDIVVPKTESREDFLKFASQDEAERKEFIKSIKPASSVGEGAEGTGDIIPPLPGEKKTDESGKEIPPSGYKPDAGTPDSIEKSHQELLTQLSVTSKELRDHRTAAGRLGKELKTANQTLTEARAEIENLKKASIPSPKDAPEMPEMPDPDDFTEGVMDDKYREAQSEHHKKMKVFYKDLAAYQNSTMPEWASKLTTQFDKIGQTAEEARSLAQTTAQATAVNETDKAWGGMWDYIKSMQKTLNLPTSIDINVINDNQTIINSVEKGLKDTEGKPFYSQTEVDAARAVIKGLPETEYANYGKVVQMINQLYLFDTPDGLPQKKYADLPEDLAYQAAIRNAGLGNDVKALKETHPSASDLANRLSQKQINDNNSATGMPPGGVGGADGQLGSELTSNERKEKLLDMTRQLRENIKLKLDTQFMDTFNTLRTEVGLAKK